MEVTIRRSRLEMSTGMISGKYHPGRLGLEDHMKAIIDSYINS